ncbi:MAG: Gfo/Idh/MocA family oxidoreductase [Armatimonadetes bacterium]|nr:Gfo/Idh/MocA family oxidoreductase [Armatimonadota bacterium]
MKGFEPVRIGLVGEANFARSYKTSIARMEEEGYATLVCVCLRHPDKYPEAVAEYQERGVPVYTAYEEMLEAERGTMELVALPTAIPDHSYTAVMALEAGYDVLVEKAPAGAVQDVDAMILASARTGRFCEVGFQNQSKNTVRAIKRRVCQGMLGRIERIAVMAEWVRDDAYYARNGWAGKLMYEGRYCLDGPSNNALAHYLFNALYWASPKWQHAEAPARVRGEVYHAHPIEGEDTAAIAVETAGGCRITYVVTLAGWETLGPISRIEGTEGVAEWSMQEGTVITWADGTREIIPNNNEREHFEVFRNTCRYLRGAVDQLNCPVHMTRVHTVAINGAYESGGPPRGIPAEYITREPRGENIFTGINEIRGILQQCYDEHKTFSEIGVPWAYETDWVDVTNYERFEMDLT